MELVGKMSRREYDYIYIINILIKYNIILSYIMISIYLI